MTPKFEIYMDNAGKYRWRLKAANGEIIATGEAYESKSACLRGIESVKENSKYAVVAKIPIRKKDKKLDE